MALAWRECRSADRLTSEGGDAPTAKLPQIRRSGASHDASFETASALGGIILSSKTRAIRRWAFGSHLFDGRPAQAIASSPSRDFFTSRRLLTSVAVITPSVTRPTRIVQTALISGVTPSRTWL